MSLDVLRNRGIVAKNVKYAKLFGSATMVRAYNLQGLAVTKGARAAIEAAGGKIED